MRGTARWSSSRIPWLLAGSCEFCQLCLHSPPSPSLSSVGTLQWMWVMRSLQHEIDMLVNHIGSQWPPSLLSHTRDNLMVRSLNLVLSTGSTTLWCLETRGLILFLVVYSSQNKNILEFCFTSSWKMANEVRTQRTAEALRGLRADSLRFNHSSHLRYRPSCQFCPDKKLVCRLAVMNQMV